MNAGPDFDLTGRWNGIYNYPALFPPNRFEAELRELGGSISGSISEPDDEPSGTGGTLRAVVEGARRGDTVTFTKMYEDIDRMPDAIFYVGTIQADGNEVSGSWEIPGMWSGTFLMVRDGLTEAAVEQRRGKRSPCRPRRRTRSRRPRSTAPSAGGAARRSPLGPRP